MKAITFVLLDVSQAEAAEDGSRLINNAACDVAGHYWSQHQRVLIRCRDQEHAFLMDELLWQRPINRFIPHCIVSELAGVGYPVVIDWLDNVASEKADILILLLDTVTPNVQPCAEIIEFIPLNEALKVTARKRYRSYQQQGYRPVMRLLNELIAHTAS